MPAAPCGVPALPAWTTVGTAGGAAGESLSEGAAWEGGAEPPGWSLMDGVEVGVVGVAVGVVVGVDVGVVVGVGVGDGDDGGTAFLHPTWLMSCGWT